MDMNNTNNRVIAAVIVVILLIGAWYLGRMERSSANGYMTQNTTETGTSTLDGSYTGQYATSSIGTAGASVSVADQTAGKTVAINSVTLPQTGWVAVRDAGGRILGAERFGTGTSNSVNVSLLRPTVAGQHYDVLLFIDNGDGLFDLHKDMVVKASDGSDVAGTFSAK